MSHTSSDILVSGSYDHTIQVWDRRLAGSTVQLTHGSLMESVLLVPNGMLLITEGKVFLITISPETYKGRFEQRLFFTNDI